MATEGAPTVTTEYGSPDVGELACRVSRTVVSPFALSGATAGGTPLWSNAIAGIVVLGLVAFGAYANGTSAETATNSSDSVNHLVASVREIPGRL